MAPVVSRLEILSPLSGVLVPLDTVPDPVFAQKMAGDGISIDPTSCEILAPVAGVVTQLHEAHHALAIMCGGVEILIHVGIDTVLLRGQMERVFVAADNKAHLRLVRTGMHQDGLTEIVAGLNSGETVICQNNAHLVDGQPIKTEQGH